MVDKAFLEKIETSSGDDVLSLSRKKPIMLVFLRHFGCVFCREALSDLADLQGFVKSNGVDLVFVHMSDSQTADKYFEKYALQDVYGVSDPDSIIYRKFGLLKGSFTQIFGLKTWLRTVDVGIIKGHGVSRKQIGDGFKCLVFYDFGWGYSKQICASTGFRSP